MYQAHGLGGRSDLPVPLWLAVYAGTAAVVFSFVALNALWRQPRFDPAAGRLLPMPLQQVLDSALLRRLASALGLAGGAFVLGTAWFGSRDVADNPAPTLLFVWFWVGLVPASLLLGPVVRVTSPLRTVARWLGGGTPYRSLPGWVGRWPAVLSLLSFLWLELVDDRGSEPRTVALFLTLYAVVHIGFGAVFGPRWFERGEGFEAYSSFVGSMAPLARRADGRWVLRNPLAGLSLAPAGHLAPIACVLLGSTAFDGLSRTSEWRDLTLNTARASYLLSGTLGLLGAIGLVALVYLTAVHLTRRYARGRPPLAERFVHSLVPIVCGYTVAHYFSFAVFQGQAAVTLISDPLGRGWDLFGTAGDRIDYTVVSTATIAVVQVGAIVTGHVLGVAAVHDRGLQVLSRRSTRTGQVPLLAAMVGFTMAGIALVVGS